MDLRNAVLVNGGSLSPRPVWELVAFEPLCLTEHPTPVRSPLEQLNVRTILVLSAYSLGKILQRVVHCVNSDFSEAMAAELDDKRITKKITLTERLVCLFR
jgi:hypothetical protein